MSREQKNSLESQKSPLRINKRFYRPAHPCRSQFHRKKFPTNYQTISPILQPVEPKSILKYLDQLQKVKTIDRSFHHKQQYYPDPQKNRSRVQHMYETTNRHSRKSSFFTLKPKQFKSIQTERDKFLQTFRLKQLKKQQMHQTFYNTTGKSQKIMDKFYDDKCLTQRSSPTFQNMLHRKIVLNDILEGVRKSQRKFIQGY